MLLLSMLFFSTITPSAKNTPVRVIGRKRLLSINHVSIFQGFSEDYFTIVKRSAARVIAV